MADLLPASFSALSTAEQKSVLSFNRGIEREALRVTSEGRLAQSAHPAKFGSKLTHPLVTTDFSEAQLELITPVFSTPDAAVEKLDEIHRYVYSGPEDECLWPASMPCALAEDSAIPLAYYGTSNLGQLKTTYRSGLGYRYGRGMQTICAVHYNFSLPDAFWRWLHEAEASREGLADFTTRRYFDLMRNFRRYSWLLTYLFGASPAVCSSFARGKPHTLEVFDEDTLYLPYATSLRSGNLGYQSDTQAQQMNICYNSLKDYVSSLAGAICTPHDDYKAMGVSEYDGYRQVNGNLLQSEAEFYSSIRAKRVPPPGENFLACLLNDGVQYVEVRLLDVNPYLPLGIDANEIRFLDTFLLYCLMTDSPAHDDERCAEVHRNTMTVVYQGRAPGLMLRDQGRQRTLTGWAEEILSALRPCAELLDRSLDQAGYLKSVLDYSACIADSSKTPSGRILSDLQSQGVSFFHLAMNLARQHKKHFVTRPLDESRSAAYKELAQRSIKQQQAIEAADTISFDDYLAGVAASYQPLV